MNCREARRLISLAADEAASETQETALALHVESCESCRERQRLQATQTQLLRDVLAGEARAFSPSTDFAAAVTARLRREMPNHAWYTRWRLSGSTWAQLATRRPAAVTAAIASAVAAVVLLSAAFAHIIDASPTAAPRVTSGHIMAFTLKPTHDGGVSALLTAHRYCQITRDREEALR